MFNLLFPEEREGELEYVSRPGVAYQQLNCECESTEYFKIKFCKSHKRHRIHRTSLRRQCKYLIHSSVICQNLLT